jgi:hypothetical protein
LILKLKQNKEDVLSITTRIRKLDLKSAFTPGDQRRIELNDIIIEKQKEIDALTEEFAKPLKAAKDALHEAIVELTEGKDEEVPCTLFIDLKANLVRTQRNDNLDWLEDREPNDEDKEPGALDEQIEKMPRK